MNDLIKTLARSEGAMLADVFAAFPANAADRARYFSDDVHPNDQGYALIAEGFLKAFTTGRAASASGGDLFATLPVASPAFRRGR
jgi:phospholipase/lecithinase/hemolysin